jgi:outer membrane protein
MKLAYARTLAGGFMIGIAAWAQTPVVSLAQAQQTALQNHPRIASAALEAQASGFAVREVRSAYYPTLSGNVTGVGTEHGSVLSAGAVTTSSIYSRGSTGIVANQLITDFGRTGSLVQSAKLRNASRNADVTNTRAQVLLEVEQAYYQALAAQAVQKVARETLGKRSSYGSLLCGRCRRWRRALCARRWT